MIANPDAPSPVTYRLRESLIIPYAVDQGTSPADQAKPVKIVRPAGRCILTGFAWPAPVGRVDGRRDDQ
jgi:hypothetical protein